MRFFAAIALAVLPLAAFAGDAEDLVARLGSEAWRDREQAMLGCLGRPELRPLLVQAAASADSEVAWRARWALGCLEWGIDAGMAKRTGNPFANFEELSEQELQLGLEAVMSDQRPQRLSVLLQAAKRFPDGAGKQAALTNLRVPVDGDRDWAISRLASTDAAERVGAALILVWRADKRGAEILKQDLATGAPAFGRELTIDALIAIGDPAGLESLLGALRDFAKKKTPPDPEDIRRLSEAPMGMTEVEEALLLALESDYGQAAGAEQARAAALAGLARRGGAKTASRLAAYWEADPQAHEEALPVAAALADAEVLKDLAGKAAGKLGGEKATADQLFTVAALQRLAGDKEAHRATVDRMAALPDLPTAPERVAEVALEYLDGGDPAKALDVLDRAFLKGADMNGPLAPLALEAAKASGKEGEKVQALTGYNNEAWELSTHPERLAPPAFAVRLAELTVKNSPELAYRGTLGVAYFRAARYDDSVKALEQNLEPYYFGKEEDMSYLAMSYKRLGRAKDAEDINQKCHEWEGRSQKTNPMRAEMERVLREP
ncbi:MAG: hypothetical protein K8T20_14145 [Planctomycetes bacterium]|nr:hypothetical protein [Planctomycetota bacterium]